MARSRPSNLMTAADYRLSQTESEFQKSVIDAARRLGWVIHHETFSIGSGAGLPDLIMWRPEGFLGKPGRPPIFAELKKQNGRLTAKQIEVIESLRSSGAPTFVWYPSDFDDILEELER